VTRTNSTIIVESKMRIALCNDTQGVEHAQGLYAKRVPDEIESRSFLKFRVYI
jgi:hypothetical protein